MIDGVLPKVGIAGSGFAPGLGEIPLSRLPKLAAHRGVPPAFYRACKNSVVAWSSTVGRANLTKIEILT